MRAAADRPTPPPAICTIYYRTEDGERGRVNMSKKGAPRDGSQQYTFDGKPFKGMLGDIQFDVVGNDQRIRDQHVRVVDSPQVVAVSLYCERPAYTELAPTEVAYYPGIQFPRGSRINVAITTNKPLVAATLTRSNGEVVRLTPSVSLSADNVMGKAAADGPPGRNTVSFPIEKLDETLRWDVSLEDTDGVASQRPYSLVLAAVADTPPVVETRMQGIGSAVTPDARIPFTGEIRDDYGVAEAWFEIQLADQSTREFALPQPRGEILAAALDLREQRTADQDPLELPSDAKIVLSVKASDHYNLDEVPNVGQSDRYELEVVSANRLIVLLEARELGLRNRFEQIISEMMEMRDSLNRVQFWNDEAETSSLTEEPAANDQDLAERAAALRQLRVQRAEQQSQRSSQEVLGVALSFDDIREELINNRVDSTDRQARILNDISNPLRNIADVAYAELDVRLSWLRRALEDEQQELQIGSAALAAVEQADQVLLELENVLEKMLDLESYAELVDLIRSMIEDQAKLTDRTREQRKKSALDLLK